MDRLLQIMDANINRACEGLRVVEEVARFILKSEGLTKELREFRHTLSMVLEDLTPYLLDSRDVEGDIGRSIESLSRIKGDDYLGIIRANLKRSEEAIRTLEEFSKLKDLKVSSEFKGLRFRLYELEKKLYQGLKIKDLRSKIKGLYAIIDLGIFKGDYIRIAVEAIKGGANLIQLRAKGVKDREFFEAAKSLRQITKENGVIFIVNDRVDLALASQADGVHLGQEDLPIGIARMLLGANRIIGISTHNLNEAIKAEEEGANYIGFGPIFSTSTKPNLLPVGIHLLKGIKERIKIPVVAVGGINEGNIQEVIEAGADGVACASCLNTEDTYKTALNLSKKFNYEPDN